MLQTLRDVTQKNDNGVGMCVFCHTDKRTSHTQMHLYTHRWFSKGRCLLSDQTKLRTYYDMYI